jgi:plasmid stabilization system protein ParE
VLDTIADHPHRYPIADGDVREAPVLRFPYCIYYRVKPREIVILAVFHTSSDPSVWQVRK